MKRSFTLIELIIVIVIIGVLSSIVIPNISNIKNKATRTALKADVKILQEAVDVYNVKNAEIPTYSQPTLGNPQIIDFELVNYPPLDSDGY